MKRPYTPPALKVLFTRNELISTAFLMLDDWDEAEDVVAEVWFRFADRIPSADDPRRYAIACTRNACRSVIRRREVSARYAAAVQPEPVPFEEPKLPDPATCALAVRVHEIITGLPPRLRTIAELHWIDEQSCREIAKALDIAPKTVENHVTRARKAILARLEK